MSNQEVKVKVGMWIQIPKLTKKQEKQLNYEINVKSGKNYQIIDCYNSTNTVARSWVEIEDDDLQVRTFHLEGDDDLFGKPLILLDENQQPLTKSTKKETIKESKPQITAQEMYIKELEKTAKSLRKDIETLETSNLRLQEMLKNSKNDVEHLENKLDESYKEQELLHLGATRIAANIRHNLNLTLEHLKVVEANDINYFCYTAIKAYNIKYGVKTSEEN